MNIINPASVGNPPLFSAKDCSNKPSTRESTNGNRKIFATIAMTSMMIPCLLIGRSGLPIFCICEQ